MITIADAIKALVPDAEFAYDDNDYSTLRWFEWNTNPNPPSWEEVQSKMIELEAIEPMRLLRIVRNRLIAETDWWAVSDRTMTPEQEAYRQALRDLPSNSSPSLNANGQLDMDSVDWPVKP